MLNKCLTKIIIILFNLSTKGLLFKMIHLIEEKNNKCDECNRKNQITIYLAKWGYDNTDLRDIKPMTKADIRRYNLKLDNQKVYKSFYTGGSTGEPLKLPYSKNRTLLRTASILYYNKLGGYNNGDRYLFIRSKPKSKLFQFLRNEILFVPNDLSKSNIEKLARTLVTRRVKVIIGYPSVIYELASYLSDNTLLRNKISIKAFISNSEPFDEERRTFIRSIINCQMIDRYSNEENGVIAQQREYGGEYIVDRFNLYVEVIDPETFLPVNEGELGKVVVTDIYSDLVPMVRYDTGDFAIASKYKNGQLWSIKQIVGRVVDRFYKTSGKPFSPLILGPYIRLPLTNLGIHIQFQLSQLQINTFRLQLKAKEGSIPIESLNKVQEGLISFLGHDAIIELKFVADIKAQASGKRPLYRNEMSAEEKAVQSDQ